ncbi:hypothetical protein PS918_00422 [Pseudomonas fluorescens]|uniref:Uncharacterized protein n=1 Tax=Pseudomonas fluorescens TaxID=294 RepID=A0A5E7QXS7_PSEFL|nr:hypothetical protein [Pseudomonas fluorescens]VVP66659.1 hypothetical protein PS918_00422 [Pseudomonas fluorescens]
MCTLTHFASPLAPTPTSPSPVLQHPQYQPQAPDSPKFQVILAGISFFHIKEISTGHVRGFRADHNEACALARSLESHI